MSLAAKVREQLISSFRAELAEHVQTMNDGLLVLEQGTIAGEERQSMLADIFRAAHSLKGAARAMGVTMIEQLAHALEGVLDAIQQDILEPTPELFTACYRALDAIQTVQTAYEAGKITPPAQALQVLADLEQVRSRPRDAPQATPASAPEGPAPPAPEVTPLATARGTPVDTPPELASSDSPIDAASANMAPSLLPRPGEGTGIGASPSPGGDETIRVNVGKLDALMAQLSELLVTKIRAEQRLAQVRHLHEFIAQWQKAWLDIRSVYNWLARQDMSSAFGVHSPKSVEGSPAGASRGDGFAGFRARTEDFTGFRVRTKATGLNRPRDIEATRGGNIDPRLGKEMSRLLNYVGSSQEWLRETSTLVSNLLREYASDTMHMALVIDELEQEIKRARMLPLNTITGTFGRMVRDLAQESGKEAVLQIIGGETELDKRVLEQIKDPLIHLLRNAVDHGIEPPQQREALGKPRTGTITISAEQLGKEVVICIADDGAGLDLEAIRQAVARRTGVDAQSLSTDDLKEAIFNTGISTSPIITDISGRGVGLDVVHRNVEALHGRIEVDSQPGAGAVFTLILPLTLTSSRGLLVRVSNEVLAIPYNAIERIMYIRPEDIVTLEGQDTILYDGRPLTLARLSDVLELPPVDMQFDMQLERARIPVVVLAAAERRMAFVVDELEGEQEVVIKSLGRQLSRVGGISGATVLGSGEVVLILNVADLIKLGLRGKRHSVLDTLSRTTSATETRARRHILIVDDSITTRTLEKNILEAAGYTVQLATDGQEALSVIATSGAPDLIVSDIVMPRLNGFELTQRIKEDPHTADVPVILVTSLDSPEDKARGIEVGADAYITKSSFDQNNLLETIEQLM